MEFLRKPLEGAPRNRQDRNAWGLDPINIPMEIEVWDRHHLPEIQSERGSSPVGSKKGGSRRGRSSENPPPVARTLSSASPV